MTSPGLENTNPMEVFLTRRLMEQYFIGIDGGGSGSGLVAIDECGEVLGRAKGGSTNHHDG